MKLKWKVCGMRDQGNIKQVLALDPDYMGFIFYKKSPRYVGDQWPGAGGNFPATTKKVGVFVNETLSVLKSIAYEYHLDYLQLHGNESSDYCQELFNEGFNLIKAFSLRQPGDLKRLDNYVPWVKFFLFDTPSNQYGGSGISFDWSLLEHYNLPLPFFLSGGVSLNNLGKLTALQLSNLAVIDVNSQFESEPGFKDLQMLKELKIQLELL